MSRLTITALLALAFLAVFLQAHATGFRRLAGAQLDLLTPLMVYAGVAGNASTIAWLAVLGGLWQDSLSASPFGVSVLPLFMTGLLIQKNRELLLSDQLQAQWMVGLAACALNPLLTLFLLVGMERRPHLGWGMVWDWLVVSLGGAALTPMVFWFFHRFNRAVHHPLVEEAPFRTDREMKRGRS